MLIEYFLEKISEVRSYILYQQSYRIKNQGIEWGFFHHSYNFFKNHT